MTKNSDNTKGQSTFTSSQIAQIKQLIVEKIRATSNKQKGIRDKIRKLGFYYSDFSMKKNGYDVTDFENLISLGKIKVISQNDNLTIQSTQITKSIEKIAPPKSPSKASTAGGSINDIAKIETDLMNENNFLSAGVIDELVPAIAGLYCICIKDINKLPKPFNAHLIERNHNIIYIGIATDSLQKRFLNQELRAKGNGTFFRSIGAVLGYKPPKGSLATHKNKSNYNFSKIDKQNTIKWINENLLVNWVSISDNLECIETKLIGKHRPLINIKKNPSALQLLLDLRKECREIAKRK